MSKVSSYFKTFLRSSSKNSAGKLSSTRDSQNSSNSPATSQIGSDAMLDETSIFFEPENTDFNYEMSEDVSSQLIATLWSEYVSTISQRNDQSSSTLFSELQTEYANALSKIQVVNRDICKDEPSPMKKDCGESFGGNYSSPSPFKDLQSMTNDSAREIHITSGHPKLFIESLIVNLVFHMNYRAEENAEPLAHLFPDLIDHKTIEGRKDLIRTLQCLSLAASFSGNCSCIRSYLKQENFTSAILFCLLLNTLRLKLEKCINSYDVAVDTDNSTVQETLHFIIYSILYTLHIFIHASPQQSHIEFDFDGLLPPQPWISTRDLDLIGLHDGQVQIPASTEGREEEKKVGENTGKLEFKMDFTFEAMTSETLMSIMELLKSISTNVKRILSSSYVFGSMSPLSSWLVKSCLVLRAESLVLLNHWVLVDGNRCVNLTSSLSSPIFDKILADHHLARLEGWDVRIDHLTVRCGILVLKLGGQLNLILPESICDFLEWLRKKYDRVESLALSLHSSKSPSGVKESTGNSIVFSVSYVDGFSKPPMIYDLWPWAASNMDMNIKMDSTMLIDESSDFRLLKPSILHIFKSNLVNFTVYVMWDIIFSELLGSRSLSSCAGGGGAGGGKKTPVQSSKIKREKVFFLCGLFQRLFEQEEVKVMGEKVPVPFCQLYFVDFISQLIKALESQDIFYIVRTYGIFDIMFGKYFLLGGPILTEQVIEIHKEERKRNSKTVEFCVQSMFFDSTVYWLVLNEMTADYLNGLVLYSTFFSNESANIPCFFTHDDVLELIIDFVKSVPLQQHHHITYQLIKLIHNILSMVSSMGYEDVKTIRDLVFVRLISLCQVQRSQTNFYELKPSSEPAQAQLKGNQTKSRSQDEEEAMQQWTFFATAAQSIVISMMIQLSTENYMAPVLPVFTDAVLMDLRKKSNEFERSISKSSRSNTADSESDFFKHSSSAKVLLTDASKQPDADSIESYCKSRIRPFVLLLLNPKTKGAGLYLLTEIIASCGHETLKLQSNTSAEDVRELKTKYRTVASEVIGALLDIVSHAAKFPARYDGLALAVDCLRLLSWLLRSKFFIDIRIFIQEFFRRSASISHLLFSLTKCVNSCSSNTTTPSSSSSSSSTLVRSSSLTIEISDDAAVGATAAAAAAAANISDILKQGLTLLTCVMASHEACKDEFGLILQSSRDSADLLKGSYDGFSVGVGSTTGSKSRSPSSSNSSNVIAPTPSKSIDSLYRLILTAEGKTPSKEVVLILFEMLLDGQYLLNEEAFTAVDSKGLFSTDEDRPKIRNINIIQDIFGLIPFCETGMQLFIYQSFQNLITGRASLVNLNACSLTKPRVLDIALDLFQFISDEVQQKNVRLIQCLGKHGVPVSSLKHLFRILHSKNDIRPAYSWRVIQALHGMVTEEDGPRQTFVFEGTVSGLQLPPIYNWPANKAFSFCVWFKIEAKKVRIRTSVVKSPTSIETSHGMRQASTAAAAPKSYCPYILCIRSQTGSGLELFLQPLAAQGYFQIVLKSHAPGKETSTFLPKNKGMRVTEGQWHFLALSVTAPTYYRSGEASCQLDDVFHRSDFHYHKISDNILTPIIGDCMESLYDTAVNTTMRGQMGAVYFFSCPLSEGQLQSIHALGPDYIYNFEPFSAVYRDVTNASKKKWVDPILSILDGVITSKIFLTFNPAVWRGEAFLDNTPSKNDLKWKVPVGLSIESALQGLDFGAIQLDASGFYKMHAFCLPGTYRSTTQDVRLALNSLGGIKIILPLFAQLDQARKNPTLLNYEARREGRPQKVDTSHDSNFLGYILDLLLILMDNNMENQLIFVKLAGFSIISCLLERVSPEHFSVEVVNKILDLCSKVEQNNALHEAMIDQLLCNFKLWVLTPLVIQETILSYIKVLTAKKTLSIDSFNFQRWVDVLSLMYDFELLSVFSAPASIQTISEADVTPVPPILESHSGKQEGISLSAFSPEASPVKAIPIGGVDDSKVAAVIQSLRTTLLCGKRTNATNFTYKLSFEELVIIRSYIFSFLHITLRNQNEILADNVHSLVSYLLHCQSTHSQIEVLKFILELLNDKQNPYFPPQVVCGFVQNNSLSALYCLFGSSCTKVRLLTTVLFTTVVQLSLNDNIIPSKIKLFRPHIPSYFDDGVMTLEMAPSNSRDRSVSAATEARESFSMFASPASANSGPSTATADIYESLDLAADVMLGVFISLQRSLLDGLGNSSPVSSSVQSLIITHALALTMFGSSPLFLFEEVVHLFSDKVDLGSDIFMWSVENSNRITCSWNEFVNGEHFKEKILYIPIILVALVDFLSNEWVPVEVRFQGMMIVHATVFSNLRNCELILSVPTWHHHFIKLLDIESKRVATLTATISEIGSGNDEYALKLSVSRIILDICCVSFCELQKNAVFIGKPKPIAKLTRLGTFNSDISANEVMNKISRGERQLGMFVLRDNINHLRDIFTSRERVVVSSSSSSGINSNRAWRGRAAFADDFESRDSVSGGLDVVRLGILLLQVSMCELQREQEQLFKMRMTSSSSGGNDLMQDHQEKIFHVNTWILFNTVFDFLNHIWAVRLQSLEVRSSTTEVENISLESIVDKLAGLANVTTAVGSEEDVDSTYNKLKWVFFSTAKSKVLKVIESKDECSKNIRDRNSNLSDTKRLWFLLLKLCVLVQPLYSEMPLAQWMYEEKYFRVTTGNAHSVAEPHLYNRGSTLQSSMQDHVLNLAMNLPNSAYLKVPQTKKIPLSHTAGGVLWLLLRVLCSTFARVGWGFSATGVTEASKEILSDAEHDFHVWQCLKQLQKILISLKVFNRELFESEAFYAAGKLSEFLRKSKEAVKDLIVDGSAENNGNEVSASDIFQIAADVVTDLVQLRASKVLEEIGDDRSTSLQEPTSTSDFSFSYESLCKSIASRLQSVVTESDTQVREVTSQAWFTFTSNEISKSEKREAREINLKLSEVEILSAAPVTTTSLASSSSHTNLENTVNQSWSSHGVVNSSDQGNIEWEYRARFVKGVIADSYMSKLKDWVKALEINYRRCDSKWARIYAESANERGPWGVGGGEKSDVFWVLDNMENHTHMKLRLRRNLLGNRHSMASQKSAGKLFRTPSSPSVQKMAKGAQQEDESASTGTMAINFKGLKKYKNEAAPQSSGRPNAKNLKDGMEGGDPAELMIELDEDDDIEESLQSGALAPDSETVVFFSATCEIITSASNSAGGRTPGKFEVSKNKISFIRNQDNGEAQEALDKIGNTEFLWACQPMATTFWCADEILSVHKRQYQLRNVAVELFFTSRTSMFINLFEIKLANKIYKLIKHKMKPPNMNGTFSGKPKDILNRPIFFNMTVTQAWVNRKISNFDYLMHLNLIAGRTFNDLSQYPVFPWVLRDYHSQKLDLKDSKVFRDFQWPIGAQNPSQRKLLIEKYKSFASLQDDEILPYHFGSHYSTSAMVIWYLIRMEPFTSYHVWLQDGKFDFPDRLFHSLEATFNGCTSNFQDVKEMIPEFFCVPEILENVNEIDMGYRQDGTPLRNVVLPNWAKDAHDFVRQHREALESEYVSRHLHLWVDLVFGFRQRPTHIIGGNENAINACNVFVHLTYKDAVNLEQIKQVDPLLYTQTIRQIDNYGQTPLQLFDKPHPERLGLDQVDTIWPIASVVAGADTSSSASKSSGIGSSGSGSSSSYNSLQNRPSKIMCYGEFKISNSPILLVVDSRPHEKLVTVDSARVIGAHVFIPRQPDIVPPFFIKVDRYALSSNISANAKGSSPGEGGGHGPSPSKNSGLAKFLTSGVKEKLAGVPFASEGMLLHGSYGRSNAMSDSHEGQVRSSRSVPLEGQGSTDRASAYMPEFKANWIGTALNKANYLAEEKDRDGHGSSGSRSSKKPSENQRPSSKSISIMSSNAAATVSTSSPGIPPRPQPVQRSTTAGSATTTPSKSDTANTVIGERARADTDTLYKSDGEESFGRVRQSSEGEASKPIMTEESSNSSKSRRSSWKKMSSEEGAGATGNIPSNSKMRSKDRVDEHLSGNLFAMLADFKLLFSCGHWDNSIKVTTIDTGRLVQSISHHRELVTCVCVASDLGKHWLVSGSKDCIVIVWELFPEGENDPVNPIPDKILYGHDDCVNCISVHPELDLIASGSDDGTIILHSLREGRYLRSILIGSSSSISATVAANSHNNSSISNRSSPTTSPAVTRSKGSSGQGRMQQHQVRVRNGRKRVHLLMISCEGYVIAYSADGNLLCCYSVNGRYIKMMDVRERLYAMCISEDGKVVLTGGERGLLVFRWIATLTIADTGGRKDLDSVVDGGDDKDVGPFPSPIRSMYLTNQERHLIVGLESGYVRILAQDSEYLRRKLHKKLIETGILTL